MGMSMIYYIDEITLGSTIGERRDWLNGLNASGYAGCKTPEGWIVDRREFPDAIPVQANSLFGVVKPKELTDEQIKQAKKKKPEVETKITHPK